MSEQPNAKNKDCHCGVKDVMAGTKKCPHGWEFPGAITTADQMREAIEKIRKLSRSPKLKELLDEMIDHVEAVEEDAQFWYSEWQSECEGRVEDQKESKEREDADDDRIQELDSALECALADREALLARQKLTDAEWSRMGGYSYVDVGSV